MWYNVIFLLLIQIKHWFEQFIFQFINSQIYLYFNLIMLKIWIYYMYFTPHNERSSYSCTFPPLDTMKHWNVIRYLIITIFHAIASFMRPCRIVHGIWLGSKGPWFWNEVAQSMYDSVLAPEWQAIAWNIIIIKHFIIF